MKMLSVPLACQCRNVFFPTCITALLYFTCTRDETERKNTKVASFLVKHDHVQTYLFFLIRYLRVRFSIFISPLYIHNDSQTE